MISLVIDTACDTTVLALARDGKICAIKELKGGFLHSRHLFPALDALCKEHMVEPSDISYIAVGVGPGSYTGIRVGVACAKAISIASSIPLVGVSTLLGFVPYEGSIGKYIAAIDAKIGGIYCLEGFFDGKRAYSQTTPVLVSAEIFFMKAENTDFIVTPDLKPLQERLHVQRDFKHQVIERSISSEAFSIAAHEAFMQKKFSVDGHVDILYLRKTQAEIEKDIKI
jgi:tRNA threonylcarbamoyladenosine biosynthesis protein TsaB